MIACSEYSQVYLILGPTFSGLLCMCTCLQGLQCRSASRFSTSNEHCEAQRMRTSAHASTYAEISNGL